MVLPHFQLDMIGGKIGCLNNILHSWTSLLDGDLEPDRKGEDCW